MKSLAATLLACSAVVVLGLGIGAREPIEAAAAVDVPSAIEPASHLLEHAAPRTEPLRVMPTVYVTATVPKNELSSNTTSGTQARLVDAVATLGGGGGSIGTSIRTGLAVPYFAFAQAGALKTAGTD